MEKVPLGLPLSMGAALAIRDNINKVNMQVMLEAEKIALERAEKDGYEAVLTRSDIEEALKIKSTERSNNG